ncbi:MAG: PHB depolymerase family esterase [Candidatus Competibacteraceae bacterium]
MTEVPEFGANPGQLRMMRYQPDVLRTPTPLVVVLHGCQQTALDYAQQTGWMQQADRWGFALLLPEQQAANNRQRCFNWFKSEHSSRDGGEALSIRQMITRMQADMSVDPERIYVTGLSAGGAMTSVMLATYPDVFAGGAIVAGIPYHCASGLFSALRCQLWGRDLEPTEWAERVRQATASAGLTSQRWPMVSIWQGDADRWVTEENAQELLEQWTQVQGLDPHAAVEETSQGYIHRVYRDTGGRPRVEAYLIARMGHGQPIDPGPGEHQCGTPADYILPVGICASDRIARFWGLAP